MAFGELPEQPVGRDRVELRSKLRQAHRALQRRKCKHPKDRARLEKDTAAWLRHYLAESYPLPFGQVHLDIIAGAEKTIHGGGKIVTVAPRGTGKTSVLWGVSLKVKMCEVISFPVYLPWKASDRRKALRFWKNALCFNKKLIEDYPEYCGPFAKSQGSSQKCATLWWADTGLPCGAELRVSDGMIVFPDGRGVIGSETINGNPRGLNHATEDGRILRPDLAFIDDAQSKEVAKSPSQTAATCDLIDTDIAGMAGPAERMPIFLSGTVSRKGDVITHYLDAKDWEAVRVGQVVTWPDNRALWAPFGEAITDKREADALKYYNEHKAELCAGMTVSWAERYDRKRGEPDALYSAMRDFYFMGEAAFMAERQGEPLDIVTSQYELTADMVMRHTINQPRLHLPASAQIVVGHCDINRVGLHWCIAGFDQQMTAHVPVYGRWPTRGDLWPENAPELVRKQEIYRGLMDLCRAIAGTTIIRDGQAVRLGMLLIDRGYEPDVVHKFASAAAFPFRVLPARGFAAHKYWPRKDLLVGQPLEGCHISKSPNGQFVAFNSDMWRETSQRAFLGEAGEPGGCTLYQCQDRNEHRPFAEHVAAERLSNKYATDAGMRWEWTQIPGTHWDWGDALTGCYVGAAVAGLSASGIIMRPRRVQETRRAKVQMGKL
jgi:hypothetical protein